MPVINIYLKASVWKAHIFKEVAEPVFKKRSWAFFKSLLKNIERDLFDYVKLVLL